MNAKRFLYLVLTAALASAVLYVTGSPRSQRHDPLSLNDELAASFRIFRTPPEVLPKAEEQRLIAGAETKALAKRASTQLAVTEQGRLWVFTAAGQVCIGQTRGVACAPWRRALREGVVLGVFDPPDEHRRVPHDFLVQGIAPDDVDRVRVSIYNSRELTLSVKSNVFSIAADKPIHIKRLLRD